MKDINIGVVGVGYLGEFHAEKYAKIGGARLVGVADIDGARGRHIAEKFKTPYFASHRDLLGKVDAVSIAVPTVDHYAVAKEFLEAGVDVFIEKPVTRTLEEADELIELAAQKNLLIQVGHLERFNPAVKEMRTAIDSPMFIESHRLGFFKERGIDVDVVLDLMIHDLDIIMSLVPSEIASIHALGVPVITSRIDIANARLVFANGCVANVTASRISMKVMRKIRIFQPNAYLSVDYAKRDLTIVKKIAAGPDSSRPQILPEHKTFEERDVLEDELSAFVDSTRDRTNPLVDGPTARKALKVSLEVVKQISKRLEESQVYNEYGETWNIGVPDSDSSG